MDDERSTTTGKRPPVYWLILVGAVALLLASWIGERQGWSSTITLVLTLAGAAVFAVDALFFRRAGDT